MFFNLAGLDGFLGLVVSYLGAEIERQLEQAEKEADRRYEEQQRQVDRDHQAELARKQGELRQKIAQANRESREKIAAADRAQDWLKHEELKALQQELTRINCQVQLAIAAIHRETTLALPEEQFFWQHWPLSLSASTILRVHRRHAQVPLRVIPSFLGFEEMEMELALVSFLQTHYSAENPLRPVEVIDGVWNPDKTHGGGSIKALFDRLSSEPILVIRGSRNGDELTCRVAYWGINAARSLDEMVVKQQSCQAIALNSLKARLEAWPQERQKYLAAGLSTPAQVDEDYGEENLTWNLQVLTEEAKLQAAGLKPKTARPYRLSAEDQQALRRVITTYHCLLAGWFADLHYLIYNNVPPLMPQLLPQLTEGIAHLSVVQEAVHQMVLGYRGVLQALKVDRPFLVPDLALGLAQGLRSFNPIWAKELLDYSLQSWLSLRTAESIPADQLLETVQAWVVPEDQIYFEAVAAFFADWRDETLQRSTRLILNRIEDRKLAIVWARQQEEQRRLEAQRQLEEQQLQELRRQEEAQKLREQEEAQRREEERRKQLIVTLKGGVILELVSIEGGSFQMGSPDGEGHSDKHPQHLVNLKPFMMGKTPVTQAQWLAVMGSYKRDPGWKGNELPIENITWREAKEFCDRLSEQTQRQFSLPTEAQWEYACRAGTKTKWSFGNNESELGKYAWFNGNADIKTHPVAQKQPNPWGLYDMHGNVWELCLDHWHGNYTGAPSDGMQIWSSSDESSNRVSRGGSWNSNSGDCRSAYRRNYNPGNRNNLIGFRVVCF
jgi:formylglycine-generating enzyme required for sulfatase activity